MKTPRKTRKRKSNARLKYPCKYLSRPKVSWASKARAMVSVPEQVMREMKTRLRWPIVWPETPTVRARMQIFFKEPGQLQDG